MNVNKKFDRLKQWGKERMGGEVRTDTSDEFKALMAEMQLRHDGMDRLKKSADVYLRALSKRDKHEDKEPQLPIGYFGATMAQHGEDFESDSTFGQCLAQLGHANERLARLQDTFCANANTSWMESVERSLLQLKEYQAARKKLESRRLAYDTAGTKLQKAKREDYRAEEELRAQKMKYEESSEDVFRRMMDIKEAETDSVTDLTTFLEAQLAYHDRCRDVLMQLQREWPATGNSPGTSSPNQRRRSRASSYANSRIGEDEQVRSRTISTSGPTTPRHETRGFDLPTRSNPSYPSRPSLPGRSQSHQTPGSPRAGDDDRDVVAPRLTRVPTEPTQILFGRANLRRTATNDSVFADQEHTSTHATAISASSSSSSLAGGNGPAGTASWSTTGHLGSQASSVSLSSTGTRKPPPPPPPPSRSKKPAPAPPPLPVKRSAFVGASAARPC